MFTKATFFAALVAGASAVAPPAYGGDSYNSTTTAVYSPEEPKTYPSSKTEVDAHEPSYPAEYPAEYPSKTDVKPHEPTYPVTYASTSSVPYSPHEPSTYESSSTTCTESKTKEEHPYKTTEAYPTKFTKTSEEYTTLVYTGTKVITVTAPHGTYVTTTESVYSTYCPKSDVSKYTKPAEEKPTHSAPVYDVKSSTKSVPYSPEKPTHPVDSPEKPKTYPAHGPLTTSVPAKKPVPSGYSTSEKVVDKVLTYTLGHGASTTVITTTVKSTSTIYLTKTVYKSKSTAEAKPTEIYPSKPTGKNENSPVGGKPDYDCKPQTVTVTAKETVYVTVPVASSTKSVVSPKKSSSAPAPYYPTKDSGYPVSSGVAKPSGFHTSYVKPSAPVYKSKTHEGKPEHSSTYEAHPKPTYPVDDKHSSTYEAHPKPTYPVDDKHSSTYEAHPKPTYPVEEKPTYPATSVVYVTPVPSKDASPKPAGYGAEKPAGY